MLNVKNRIKNYFNAGKTNKSANFLESSGYCHACGNNADFIAEGSWLRDEYKCSNCRSIPRERALMMVLESYCPDWRNRIIHESSPNKCGASMRIASECSHYTPSQLFKNVPFGEYHDGERCENFEALTFEDESIDVHISQDVMEHVFDPAKAFSEIERTLKPGGFHIFTVPIPMKDKPTRKRAEINDTEIVYLEEAIYHGNPVDENGALVVYEWGYDICNFIFNSSNLFTHTVIIDDLSKGIRAELIEVLVTVKPNC